MNAPATTVPPPLPSSDTRRSWRLFRKVLACAAAVIAAAAAFSLTWSDYTRGDTPQDIAWFEAALGDYVLAGKRAGYPQIGGIRYHSAVQILLSPTPGLEPEQQRLHFAANRLHWCNRGNAASAINQTFGEYTRVGAIGDPGLQALVARTYQGWQTIHTAQAILKSLGALRSSPGPPPPSPPGFSSPPSPSSGGSPSTASETSPTPSGRRKKNASF